MKSDLFSTRNERSIQTRGCFLIVLAGLIMSSCGPKNGTSTTILLDQSYSTDDARASLWVTDHISCDTSKAPASEPWECEAAARDQRGFISQFSTAFASDSACSGLELIVSDIRNNPDREISLRNSSKVQSAWWLGFAYDHSSKASRGWTLDRMPAMNSPRHGEGTPSQIARQVCAIVSGKGGKVS